MVICFFLMYLYGAVSQLQRYSGFYNFFTKLYDNILLLYLYFCKIILKIIMLKELRDKICLIFYVKTRENIQMESH